jgi:hypothetical protein
MSSPDKQRVFLLDSLEFLTDKLILSELKAFKRSLKDQLKRGICRENEQLKVNFYKDCICMLTDEARERGILK